MAGIEFEDYIVSEASFKKNSNFEHSKDVSLDTDIICNINIEREKTADVILTCKIGDLKGVNSPFQVDVTIIGNFKYNKDASDGIAFENLLSPNAIAILYPYLRTTISTLTSLSNDFPTLNMPVINIAKMMEDHNLIEIKHFE
ncbi:protein-export chaperone SecB [Lysinibacillus sp. HST-98]|uniref:protein-export chaperone SecB n=1 Tax=Lysinibacillus sp. HST-98 TaxID=2800419 RepID=UPI00192544F2|nr:protein-export chaperone SecB [Lysinibacillus sp. HST-98]MBL3731782.1 protein-export chaperone SecB [Lysinibacillus sp. HST-98]